MAAKFDVIIIGGGAVGTSALFHLSKRGIGNALLLEKLSGYGRGASGTWGPLVRMFHANPVTTAAASKSVPFYVDFNGRVGEPFQWKRTGSLYFLKKAALDGYKPHFDALRSSGLEFSLIEPRQGKEQFPDFSWFEDDVAVFEPNAGVASPQGTTGAFLRASARRGAVAKLDAEVVEIVRTGRRVTGVKTRGGDSYECGQLVVCSGIWTNEILQSAGAQVAAFPRPIQLNRFCRRHGRMDQPFFIDLAALTFGHPTQNGSFIGGYFGADSEDGAGGAGHVNLNEANRAKHLIARRIPWVKSATLEGGIKALENYTESRVGFVQKLDEYENVIVSTGWSCSGFTLAPIIGERIAQLIG